MHFKSAEDARLHLNISERAAFEWIVDQFLHTKIPSALIGLRNYALSNIPIE
jgi:hypothetical protein